MEIEDGTEAIEAARLIPVVTVTDARQAEPLADALLAGGIRAIEVTLRTPAGVDAIARIGHRDDILVGAGTVLTIGQAEEVASAGARFAISPGLVPEVVTCTRQLGMLPLPGVATPSEVQLAHILGLRTLKLFPAGVLGGLRMVDALHGPFPGMRFVPSGGVTQENARQYLAHPAVAAVSGSWMVPQDAVAAGDWTRITRLAEVAMAAIGGGDAQ